MRFANDPSESKGPFAEFMRLQTEFYTRLTEETSRYLRRLQAAGTPAVPGTVLLAEGPVNLQISGAPGTSVELTVEVENRQRVHSMVMPLLSPLVNASGTTWFPAAEPLLSSLLLAPEEVAPLVMSISLPANIPAGIYRGALLLQGFRNDGIPVAVTVTNGAGSRRSAGRTPGAPNVSRAKAGASGDRPKKLGKTPARRK